MVLRARQLPESELTVGKARAACGKAGLEYVRLAAQLCLCGNADAMVTGPLCKEAVALNGMDFCGHTEFLAELWCAAVADAASSRKVFCGPCFDPL